MILGYLKELSVHTFFQKHHINKSSLINKYIQYKNPNNY